MIGRHGGEVVTRLRPTPTGDVDRYGKPITVDVETDLPGALVAPARSSEPAEVGRNRVDTNDAVYWRGSVDLNASDRLRVRGDVREIEGRPAVWKRGGRVVGVVANLTMTEG